MKHGSFISFLWPESILLRISYLLGIFIYLILSLYFFNTFVPEVVPDTIAYLNIAQKYSAGNLTEALNAYWSPLISWLLTPLLWLNINPFTALKIFNLITGLGFLIFTIKIFDRFLFTIPTRIFSFATICIFSFFYQSSSATPDFLSACLVCIYLYFLSNPQINSDKYYFIKVGITAALCFFSKSYFLVFFIVQFFLFCLWEIKKYPKNKKSILRNAVKVYFVFFIIVGIWISLISFKYQKFIVSSSGPYNFSLLHDFNGVIGLKPQYYANSGLLTPPDKYSVCSWTDPTYYPVETRNPFQSKENFKFQWKVIKHNFSVFFYLLKWFSYFGWFILLIGPYLLFISKSKPKDPAIAFIFSSIIYMLGYIWFFYEERYMLPALFISIFSMFFFVEDLYQKFNFPQWTKILLLIIVSISFLKNPLDVWRFKNINLAGDERLREAAQKLNKADWLKNKKIASSNFQYGISSYIALLQGGQYFGGLPENATLHSLEANQIDYYFCYDCEAKNKDEKISGYLENKSVVYRDKKINLMVYKLR